MNRLGTFSWERFHRPNKELSRRPRHPGTWLHVVVPGEVVERPPRPAWISDALLAETIDVWTEAYGRPVSEEDAIEILRNVRRLAEALLEAKREMKR